MDEVLPVHGPLPSPRLKPLHAPEPHAYAFAQADVIRQADVAGEVQGKALDLPLFEGEPALVAQLGDGDADLVFDLPADARSQGEDVAGEQVLEEE